jgi:hypothetical protein
MSLMPSPPYLTGAHIFFQLTKHFPPETLSSLGAQRKERLKVLNLFSSQGSGLKMVKKYVAVAVVTLLIKVTHPLWFRNFPFHPLRRPIALSTRG